MKNKRKVLAPTIAGLATCSMVLPLALSATSCSCSKFASTSVLDGDYIPDFEPYDAGVDAEGNYNFVNIPQGEDLMLKAYINDKKMPAKEHRWMASGAAYYLTYAADWVNNQLGYDAIKINKYNADLKNFKVEDSRTGRVSYDISQDIDVTLDVQPGNLPWPSNLKLDSIAGNIRLAWNHKVKNMPLGIFDLGTDSWDIFGTQKIQKRLAPYGDKPFTDMTVWFVAPDMSEVPVGDKTWALDLDFLIDADIDVNGDKLIDIDHEYNFTFDKYAAWGVEELVRALSDSDQEYAKVMGIAYILERFIPLCSGWMSYYLNQCHHMDHIISDDPDDTIPKGTLGWQTPITYTMDPEVIHVDNLEKKIDNAGGKIPYIPAKPIHRQHIYAYTKSRQEANIVYELADGTYTKNDIFAACIGVNTGGENFSVASLFKSLLKGRFPFSVPRGINTITNVSSFGKTISLKFDWSKSDEGSRPAYGQSSQSLLGYDYLLPIVMTKDWVAVGDPFTLVEGGHIWDMYPNHQTEPYATEIIPTNGALGEVLSFAIDQQTYNIIQNEPSRLQIQLVQETTGPDAHDVEIISDDMNCGPQDNGLGYVLNLPVQIQGAEWGDIPVSHQFHIKATYDGDILETAPFMLISKGSPQPTIPIRWATNVSKLIPLNMDKDANETALAGCILYPEVNEEIYPVTPVTGEWPAEVGEVYVHFDREGKSGPFNPNGTLVMTYKNVGVPPEPFAPEGGIQISDSKGAKVGTISGVEWVDTAVVSSPVRWNERGDAAYHDGVFAIPKSIDKSSGTGTKSIGSLLVIDDYSLANHSGEYGKGEYKCDVSDGSDIIPGLTVTIENANQVKPAEPEPLLGTNGNEQILTMNEYLNVTFTWDDSFLAYLNKRIEQGQDVYFSMNIGWIPDGRTDSVECVISETDTHAPLKFILVD